MVRGSNWILSVASVLVFAVLCSTAHAGKNVKFVGGPYQYGQGGEFTLIRLEGLSNVQLQDFGNQSWQTFCVEMLEHISYNSEYYAEVNNAAGPDSYAIHGGELVSDPISGKTAYLYTLFSTQTTTADFDYNFSDASVSTGSRKSDAGALQQAFWHLEQEQGYTVYANLSARAKHFVDAAGTSAASDWIAANGIGRVRVLNMGTAGDQWKYQDQLVMLVPLPPAALLGIGLLAGLGIVRRVRRSRS